MEFDVENYINGVYVPFEELHLYQYKSRNLDMIVNSIIKKQEEQMQTKKESA